MRVLHRTPGGLTVLAPRSFHDARGTFQETWNARTFARIGLEETWVQDNDSWSRAGVLRGLHFQQIQPQAKLVRVVRGRSWHVAVDLRVGPDFGRWTAVELSAEAGALLFVPLGFAHGFCALEDVHVQYKVSAHYHPPGERGLRWDDPALGIPWPVPRPVLSPKDQALPHLAGSGPFFP